MYLRSFIAIKSKLLELSVLKGNMPTMINNMILIIKYRFYCGKVVN